MTKLYLSGPMSGLPDFNAPTFNSAATALRAAGFAVVNPAELDAQDEGEKTWEEYLRRDIAHLVTCDAIALLPGWKKSRGAKLEKYIADALGMPNMLLTRTHAVCPNRANGGQARAANLSPERRKEIAKKAAQTRWQKAKQPR